MFQEDSKNVNESQRYVTVSLAVFTMRRIAFWHYSAEGFFVKYFPHLLIKFNFLIFLNMILMKSRTTTKTKADLNFIDFVLSNLMDADMYHERYIATSNMTGILGIEIVKKALLCEKLSLRVHANEQSNTGLDSIHAAHIRNICHIMNKMKANARTFVALATICPEYGELNNLVASWQKSQNYQPRFLRHEIKFLFSIHMHRGISKRAFCTSAPSGWKVTNIDCGARLSCIYIYTKWCMHIGGHEKNGQIEPIKEWGRVHICSFRSLL